MVCVVCTLMVVRQPDLDPWLWHSLLVLDYKKMIEHLSSFNQDTPSTGFYDDSASAGNETISNNSRSKHKLDWRNIHIRCSNKAVIQAVSCFAIGFAEQFVTESGGDISLTNSNSNFGANALCADGYRRMPLIKIIRVILLISFHQRICL